MSVPIKVPASGSAEDTGDCKASNLSAGSSLAGVKHQAGAGSAAGGAPVKAPGGSSAGSPPAEVKHEVGAALAAGGAPVKVSGGSSAGSPPATKSQVGAGSAGAPLKGSGGSKLGSSLARVKCSALPEDSSGSRRRTFGVSVGGYGRLSGEAGLEIEGYDGSNAAWEFARVPSVAGMQGPKLNIAAFEDFGRRAAVVIGPEGEGGAKLATSVGIDLQPAMTQSKGANAIAIDVNAGHKSSHSPGPSLAIDARRARRGGSHALFAPEHGVGLASEGDYARRGMPDGAGLPIAGTPGAPGVSIGERGGRGKPQGTLQGIAHSLYVSNEASDNYIEHGQAAEYHKGKAEDAGADAVEAQTYVEAGIKFQDDLPGETEKAKKNIEIAKHNQEVHESRKKMHLQMMAEASNDADAGRLEAEIEADKIGIEESKQQKKEAEAWLKENTPEKVKDNIEKGEEARVHAKEAERIEKENQKTFERAAREQKRNADRALADARRFMEKLEKERPGLSQDERRKLIRREYERIDAYYKKLERRAESQRNRPGFTGKQVARAIRSSDNSNAYMAKAEKERAKAKNDRLPQSTRDAAKRRADLYQQHAEREADKAFRAFKDVEAKTFAKATQLQGKADDLGQQIKENGKKADSLREKAEQARAEGKDGKANSYENQAKRLDNKNDKLAAQQTKLDQKAAKEREKAEKNKAYQAAKGKVQQTRATLSAITNANEAEKLAKEAKEAAKKANDPNATPEQREEARKEAEEKAKQAQQAAEDSQAAAEEAGNETASQAAARGQAAAEAAAAAITGCPGCECKPPCPPGSKCTCTPPPPPPQKPDGQGDEGAEKDKGGDKEKDKGGDNGKDGDKGADGEAEDKRGNLGKEGGSAGGNVPKEPPGSGAGDKVPEGRRGDPEAPGLVDAPITPRPPPIGVGWPAGGGLIPQGAQGAIPAPPPVLGGPAAAPRGGGNGPQPGPAKPGGTDHEKPPPAPTGNGTEEDVAQPHEDGAGGAPKQPSELPEQPGEPKRARRPDGTEQGLVAEEPDYSDILPENPNFMNQEFPEDPELGHPLDDPRVVPGDPRIGVGPDTTAGAGRMGVPWHVDLGLMLTPSLLDYLKDYAITPRELDAARDALNDKIDEVIGNVDASIRALYESVREGVARVALDDNGRLLTQDQIRRLIEYWEDRRHRLWPDELGGADEMAELAEMIENGRRALREYESLAARERVAENLNRRVRSLDSNLRERLEAISDDWSPMRIRIELGDIQLGVRYVDSLAYQTRQAAWLLEIVERVADEYPDAADEALEFFNELVEKGLRRNAGGRGDGDAVSALEEVHADIRKMSRHLSYIQRGLTTLAEKMNEAWAERGREQIIGLLKEYVFEALLAYITAGGAVAVGVANRLRRAAEALRSGRVLARMGRAGRWLQDAVRGARHASRAENFVTETGDILRILKQPTRPARLTVDELRIWTDVERRIAVRLSRVRTARGARHAQGLLNNVNSEIGVLMSIEKRVREGWNLAGEQVTLMLRSGEKTVVDLVFRRDVGGRAEFLFLERKVIKGLEPLTEAGREARKLGSVRRRPGQRALYAEASKRGGLIGDSAVPGEDVEIPGLTPGVAVPEGSRYVVDPWYYE